MSDALTGMCGAVPAIGPFQNGSRWRRKGTSSEYATVLGWLDDTLLAMSGLTGQGRYWTITEPVLHALYDYIPPTTRKIGTP